MDELRVGRESTCSHEGDEIHSELLSQPRFRLTARMVYSPTLSTIEADVHCGEPGATRVEVTVRHSICRARAGKGAGRRARLKLAGARDFAERQAYHSSSNVHSGTARPMMAAIGNGPK
jgi:hypothetical protein